MKNLQINNPTIGAQEFPLVDKANIYIYIYNKQQPNVFFQFNTYGGITYGISSLVETPPSKFYLDLKNELVEFKFNEKNHLCEGYIAGGLESLEPNIWYNAISPEIDGTHYSLFNLMYDEQNTRYLIKICKGGNAKKEGYKLNVEGAIYSIRINLYVANELISSEDGYRTYLVNSEHNTLIINHFVA